jgi:hypothetical protein
MNWERLAVWAVLGVVLTVLELSVSEWGFWSVLALFWTVEYLARQEGEQYGAWLTANLDIEALKDIKEQIRKFEQEENRK